TFGSSSTHRSAPTGTSMDRRVGRGVVLAAAACLIGAALAVGSPRVSRASPHERTPPRPNILFILTDDQRWDSMWAMPTVNADLAQHGMTLTNYFLSDPLCCPSRSSYMRGQYAHGTGVYDNQAPYGAYPRFHEMGDDRSNIATWLHDAGYRTALIGKYLNGYGPLQAGIVPPGWDQWNALINTGYYNFSESVNGVATSFPSNAYQTDVLGQQALDFMASTPTDQPFFLYWAPHAPHSPATPAAQDIGSFDYLAPYRPPSFNEPDVSDKPQAMQKQ